MPSSRGPGAYHISAEGRKFCLALAAVLLAAVMVTVALPGSGGSDESDAATSFDSDNGYFMFTVTDEENHEVSVAAKSGAALPSALEIPETVTYDSVTYTVTSVAMEGFSSRSSIVSVTLPDTLESIGDGAFYECGSLESVAIPDSVETIGINAFQFCTSMASLYIGSSVETIGDFAFSNCTSLTSVTVPDSVTYIGEEAFSYCSALKHITLGSSVETIGFGAFALCTSLKSVVIPDSVTLIDQEAFEACTSLESVTIGSSVETIAADAFAACTSLTFVAVPPSVTTIENEAFAECSALTEIAIPSTVTTYGDSVLEGCTELATVYMDLDAYDEYSDDLGLSSLTRHNYSYDIVFHGNGGRIESSGTDDAYYGIRFNFDQTATRLGYVFAGWNTEADGSGATYSSGDIWSIYTDGDATIGLYAQWELDYVFLFAVLAGITVSVTTVALTYHYKKEQ
ncbi:MAG: leucine-rich repeat protein [Methanomethylophilus sp.]|jgi:uncharacterized repeat protein (TIGR02543 family)